MKCLLLFAEFDELLGWESVAYCREISDRRGKIDSPGHYHAQYPLKQPQTWLFSSN